MKAMQTDVKRNRAEPHYAASEFAGRIAWALLSPLFRWSPRHCYFWRNGLLRLLGAKIGRNVRIYPSARIFLPWKLEIGDWATIGWDVVLYNPGKITIGERTTISQRAHLCAGTHDHARSDMPLLKRPILLGNDVWICTDAFVGPGVIVGDGAVVGARAVAIKPVEPWSIVAGNPAVLIKRRELHDPPTSAPTEL